MTVARDWISVVTSSNGATNRVWVDTVSDLNQYKPSQDELEARKLARKSNNKLLAKVLFNCRNLFKKGKSTFQGNFVDILP